MRKIGDQLIHQLVNDVISTVGNGKIIEFDKENFSLEKNALINFLQTEKFIPKKFVSIPSGNFTMGSNAQNFVFTTDELPEHHVVISKGFELKETEVTQLEWYQLMGYNPSIFKDKIPWFILGYILCSAFFTWLPKLDNVAFVVDWLAKKGLILTLFLIGSNITKDTVKNIGMRPLIQGYVS